MATWGNGCESRQDLWAREAWQCLLGHVAPGCELPIDCLAKNVSKKNVTARWAPVPKVALSTLVCVGCICIKQAYGGFLSHVGTPVIIDLSRISSTKKPSSWGILGNLQKKPCCMISYEWIVELLTCCIYRFLHKLLWAPNKILWNVIDRGLNTINLLLNSNQWQQCRAAHTCWRNFVRHGYTG